MESQRPRRSTVVFSLMLVGIGAALAAVGAAYVGVHFVAPMPPADVWLFYLAAPVAALLIGPLFWWRFLLKPNRLTLRRGIGVGILGSVVAHPLTWFLVNLWAYLTGMHTAGFGFLTATSPLELIWSPVLAIFSLIYVGWLTTLVGAAMGGSFTWAYRSCPRVQGAGSA